MKTILVVDDEARIRKIIGQVLIKKGFNVIKAKDAMEAHQLLKEGRKVDLILLDINMPEVQGDTLCEVVQSFHYRTKVVICSVLPVEEQSKRIPEASDYFDKTDDSSVLLQKIEMVFEKEEERLRFEKKKLEQVLRVEAELHSVFDLNKLIDFVVERTCEILEAEKCSVMFIDHQSGELCIKGHHGIEECMIGKNILKIGDNIERLMDCHKTKYPASSLKDGFLKIDGTVYQSETFLSVPIELKDHLLGIINISDKKEKDGRYFTDLDLKILFIIVRQVRIAIENAKLFRELKYLAMTDPLTGIYNYRYFTQTLDYEVVRAQRYKRSLSFLMIDVDRFKSYNDAFGHLEGDNLLKMVAKIIKQNIRETDMVCRYAGDEFALILPETDLIQAKGIAEKIVKKILELSNKHPISVSIGVAQSNSHSDRYDLIRRADSYLYSAKQLGKNQVSGAWEVKREGIYEDNTCR